MLYHKIHSQYTSSSIKYLLSYVIICSATAYSLFHPALLESANLTSVKDTLQSSRLSVNARVDSTGTTTGSSNVKLKTAASAPSYTISTNPLRAGDSLVIGTGTYTIVDILDTDEFTVTPVLASGDTDDNDPIYLKSRPRHTIQFTTASAVANGYFQILLPADSTTPNDGNPDDEGYDFNTTVTVTAPSDVGSTFDFVAGVATASGATGCTSPANYHCFEFHYSGSGAVGQAFTLYIGNTNGTNTPIAPAPNSSHAEGTADSYPVLVRQFAASTNPNSATPVDATVARVAHIESVRVTATVDPTISFSIAGVSSGSTRCGVSTDVTTTALSVPFGSMTLNTFKNLAQDLTVSTNASGGYVVTASENDQLGLDGATSPFIPDNPGNNTLASESVSDEWTTATVNGFGFSLQNVDAASVAFQYTTATGSCSGTFCSWQFADVTGSEASQRIFCCTTD
ncbi:MAG: hypothetical protein E6P95_01060, partial [Candidatus Moraniibacteriota bacterium]